MTLTFDPAALPAHDYTLGPFTVSWTPAGGGGLTVRHARLPGRVLWASQPGVAFVEAARGIARAHEARGHVRVRDRTVVRCADQHLATIEHGGAWLRLRGALRGGRATVGYSFTLAAAGADELGFALSLDDPRYNRTALVYAAAPGEGFYGFGVQYTHLNMRGRRLPIICGEQGIGRGLQPLTLLVELRAGAGGAWHSTYAPAPHYLTSAMRSLYLTTYEYAVFDLRGRDRARVELFAPRLAGRIVAGASPAELIATYTAGVGRMPPLPDWIGAGAVVGLQGGTERALSIWRRLRAAGVPLAGLWLQDWVGRRVTSFGHQLWWSWELDASHYPSWDELRAEVEAAGARLLIYVNPFLVDTAVRGGAGRNLYAEARAAGLLVRDPAGAPYELLQTDFHAGLVDLANPAACAFLKAAIGAALDATGAAGWMADFGEGLPLDARLHGGQSGASWRNRYPEVWARLNAELAAERAERAPVFFLRAGYRGSPGHGRLFWLGDQLTSWDGYDGLKSAVTGLLSGGLSGFSLSHSDTGGYTTINNWPLRHQRSRELLLRWAELSALTALLRTHEGSRPWANHQVYSDETTLAHFARCARLYAALAPYRRALMAEAAATGLPLVRHPLLQFPDDPAMWQVRYELFLLGSELLVAPALDPGLASVRVTLPPGPWELLWDGRPFAGGGSARIPAPLGFPAILHRPGSAVAARVREALGG